MAHLYIICEGDSEQIFVNRVIAPYLYANGCKMVIVAPILKDPKAKNQSHKGGRVTFARIENYVKQFLQQQSDCIITTFIDFYALGSDFPNYNDAQKIQDLYARVQLIESAVSDKINNNKVIPYLQVHEFEMFYFADADNFIQTDILLHKIQKNISEVNKDYVNPEEINNSPNKAPSKRIECFFNLIKLKYRKTHYVGLYAQKCEINILLSKCQHFRKWLERLLVVSRD